MKIFPCSMLQHRTSAWLHSVSIHRDLCNSYLHHNKPDCKMFLTSLCTRNAFYSTLSYRMSQVKLLLLQRVSHVRLQNESGGEGMVLTSSDAERRHCTAACFFISSRLRSVPPFFLLLPHFLPVPFSQPRKMSFSFCTNREKSVAEDQ